MRRNFEFSRELVAQAIDRAKYLIEHSRTSRRLRDAGVPPSPAMSSDVPAAEMATHVQDLSELTGALLDYSRLSIHFRPSEARIVDINDIVSHTVTTLETRAAQRHQQLSAHAAIGRVFVSGDPARLRQAVANLVENALRYTPEEGTISVSVGAAERDVSIEVRDSGEGIAPDKLPSIFEPFRARASSGRLGIGLALVRRIAEMHGGAVTAASAGRGTGSLFTLCLPRWHRR